MDITGRQVAAARELLGLSKVQLAALVGVASHTIKRWESGQRAPRRDTVERVLQALVDRGIEFTNGTEPGVKFRPSKAVIQM